MRKNLLSKIPVTLLTDFILSIFLFVCFVMNMDISSRFLLYAVLGVSLFFLIRFAFGISGYKRFGSRISFIRGIVAEFKKGKFNLPRDEINERDDLGIVCRDLVTVGKHLEDIMTSQSSEIMNLREMYNNIVLSISSYFIVINETEEIIFANESFCRKLQFELSEIAGKRLEDVFFFITGRLRDAIRSIKATGEPLILDKTHILSKSRISIIGNIKLSKMLVKGENQIIIVIDDITGKTRKDYQISLISQISESIQRDDEIDRILYNILTGVTSGSGLGFNRAMLFLFSENRKQLVGKMAVGPDNFDEAIEIWNSIQTNGKESLVNSNSSRDDSRKGKILLEKVLSASFPANSENIFTRSLNNLENIHVHDSYSDDRVDVRTREFIDVNEFVIVPLIAVNRPIGVIVADNKFNQVPIGQDSIELLSIFAFQAALSIEGYRNISKLRKEMKKIKDRQEAMVESEKLAAIGRIASHIAHEIRNPLVTMGGYAKRILQIAENLPKNGEGISKSADVILKESERLEKTLSNVMDFTRETRFILEFNDINTIIKDTCSLLKNLFLERKVEFELNLEDIPLVKSDFNQFKQVFLNLLQNAIDSTPNGGYIEVVTETDDKNVIILVKNSGSGILEEDIDIIFDPFYTTKVTGVGLGLAIVKKIIADHNGEISVRNTDSGVEFKIQLPLPGRKKQG